MAFKTDLVSLGAIGTGAFIAVAATGLLFASQASSRIHEIEECVSFAIASAPSVAIDLAAARGSGSNAVVVAPNVRISRDVSRNASCADVVSLTEFESERVQLRIRDAREQLERAQERMERDFERAERIQIDLGGGFLSELTAQLQSLELELGDAEMEEMNLDTQLDFLTATLDRLSGNNDEVSEAVREALQERAERLQAEIAERAGGNGGM